MTEINAETSPTDGTAIPAGFLYVEQTSDAPQASTTLPSAMGNTQPATPLPARSWDRIGTIEHLAAHKTMPSLDPATPEIQQLLNALRTDVTHILTSLRWENQSIEKTAERLRPWLNIGPINQWKPLLLPYLYEIDRGGIFIPTWLHIIEQGDPPDLPVEINPAETSQGRARRYAILMLGNYRMVGISGQGTQRHFASRKENAETPSADLAQYLGQLATDPTASLYATEALVKHATSASMQALIRALQEAKGWAKVDVVEGCLQCKQERFFDLLVANGLAHVSGLESYVALPLYRLIPLERYLEDPQADPHLKAQAALIFQQTLLDSALPPTALTASDDLPPVFSGHFPQMAQALLSSAQAKASWQNAVALHQLGSLMGRYWSEIHQGKLKDPRIIEPIQQVLPLMPEVERWMNGPGRDILLQTLADPQEEQLQPAVRVLGELCDPRAAALLIARLENTQTLKERKQALTLGSLCDTLAHIGDARAIAPMFQLLARTVPLAQRRQLPKHKDNLPLGDPNIPGSIVYAAVLRASGQLQDTSILNGIWDAIRDLDPYVRIQALEALKHLDARGENPQSRDTVRQALSDPSSAVVRTASQLTLNYRDAEALPLLRDILKNRPELADPIQEILKQFDASNTERGAKEATNRG